MRVATTVYVLGYLMFIVGFGRAADRRVGRARSATRSPLREGLKLWLLLPFFFMWPAGLLCRGWLLDRYIAWRYEAVAP